MKAKRFSRVLHGHIPCALAHGSWPHGMDWLFEAAAESYIPLLEVFEKLRDEDIPPRASVSFTQVLMEQGRGPSVFRGCDSRWKHYPIKRSS
jgi:predicted glycosyl hydrolase (DUF1957 family)